MDSKRATNRVNVKSGPTNAKPEPVGVITLVAHPDSFHRSLRRGPTIRMIIGGDSETAAAK
jgi:hypothetical protein